jgi:acylphosphatase
MIKKKYIVSGRVQGVGFRYFVYSKAKALPITGYVKNQFDGTVECVAQGKENYMQALVTILKQGPSMSRVDKILDWDMEIDNEISGFEIR